MDRETLRIKNKELHAKREKLRASQSGPPRLIGETSPGRYSPPPSVDSSKREELETTHVVLSGSTELWRAFDATVHVDAGRAKRAIYDWYHNGICDGYSFLLVGGVGCGKSHLARAVVESLTPYKALFIEESDFIGRVHDSYGTGGPAPILQKMLDVEVLAYDDLGAYQSQNVGHLENLYRHIFEDRLAKNKPTLITSNLSFFGDDGGGYGDLFSTLGPRNYDRLIGATSPPGEFYYADMFKVPSYRRRVFSQHKQYKGA